MSAVTEKGLKHVTSDNDGLSWPAKLPVQDCKIINYLLFFSGFPINRPKMFCYRVTFINNLAKVEENLCYFDFAKILNIEHFTFTNFCFGKYNCNVMLLIIIAMFLKRHNASVDCIQYTRKYKNKRKKPHEAEKQESVEKRGKLK
jgi:hypothetical protein